MDLAVYQGYMRPPSWPRLAFPVQLFIPAGSDEEKRADIAGKVTAEALARMLLADRETRP